jgi:hypothetical protein
MPQQRLVVPGLPMDIREIKKLIGLMNDNGLSRLEVEEEGKR